MKKLDDKKKREKFEFNLNTAPILGIGLGAVGWILYLSFRFVIYFLSCTAFSV